MDKGKEKDGWSGTSNPTLITQSSSEPRPLKDGVEAYPGGTERLLTLKQQIYEKDTERKKTQKEDTERANM